MNTATSTAPAGRRPRVRLLTACLAVVLALLASLAAAAAPRNASAARPTTPSATVLAHQPTTPAPKAVSRSTAGHPTTQPAATPAPRTVVLRPGDTLWALARHYHTTVSALGRANHLADSTVIYAGHRLTIPTSVASTGSSHPSQHSKPRTTVPAASGAAAAVAFARHQLGVSYLWGGTGNGGYDCSGLVQAAWRSAGVTLPRTAAAQASAGTRISRTALQPGDLVFTYGYGHVQLYAGGGRVIEAAHSGTSVRYAALPRTAAVDAYVRVRGPARTTTATKATDASYIHTTTAPAAGPVRQIAAQVFGSEYECVANIIARESGWKTTATNPSSGAYGLGQALPGSKMADSGSDWRANPLTQLRWMRSYVNARYGGACTAWAFWQTHRWY
ncbi:NlpC/P60 family protein [Streptomyces fuscichromogenes]|uniref:Uncharacterized protein n=1 Tax=Streptomyces fuscichromogenes TaxID=1324013 RepID=A0A917XII4_9ACTN|nr:NlpC/P60 family protein [Streptomyces fuscichromogenes]GGN29933.1 hypothetical protein GCM10011578_066660 [Streptomyces fuscichromogenes]